MLKLEVGDSRAVACESVITEIIVLQVMFQGGGLCGMRVGLKLVFNWLGL